ncbi:MAG: bifunctional UDP-N-acetylglucosamine diphosphorylase/glucosamine-1-phosphate N-acetyltransferase GlmU, partial [Actinomycetota bacterium]
GSVSTSAAAEIEGVNDRLQLAAAAKVLWRRKVAALAASGVTVEDPETTYVDVNASGEPHAVLRPLTFVEGATRIGAGCLIGPSTRLVDSIVEEGAEVTFAVVKESSIGPGASVGPFASLRPGTRMEAGSKVGTFVETKASTIGEGSKVPHLSYVGDADIGKGVNLAAGTITANYDTESKVKSRTVVEDGAFTGSDTTLIAPIRVGRNAGTGAGSVVTKDVEDGQIVAGVPARPFRKRKLEKG